MDHFMLEGVKALFRFTMAILYLAFQVSSPSSCEIYQTIRKTAKEMYDIKLLLSIVGQIKLPKDSYFAIRRSFYMVQSSFNSDQFYMQTLANNETNRNKSQLADTKPPALSLMCSTNLGSSFANKTSICVDKASHKNQHQQQQQQPAQRIKTSCDKTKICVQSIGRLGRSHLKIIDAKYKSNERSLMSPLRNCLVVGISNCGSNLILVRQSSRRNYRSFREQDLNFHVFEFHTELYDGFYLEQTKLTIILTHHGEIFKIDTSNLCSNNSIGGGPIDLGDCIETLMLKESSSIAENERIKLRLCTLDCLTNLLWVYVDCEDLNVVKQTTNFQIKLGSSNTLIEQDNMRQQGNKYMNDFVEYEAGTSSNLINQTQHTGRPQRKFESATRKIIIIDIVSFDLFSAFAVHPNFGEITNLRASLVAFCQMTNPASNHFSTRIVQIGPTGHYEQLLSFSDVVDFMISLPESYKRKFVQQSLSCRQEKKVVTKQQGYSTLRRLLTSSNPFGQNQQQHRNHVKSSCKDLNSRIDSRESTKAATLTNYCRSLLRSYSTTMPQTNARDDLTTSQGRHLANLEDCDILSTTSGDR